MDKNVLTAADIEALKNAASKLKPGEIVTATLSDRIIKAGPGMPKVVKSLDLDYTGEEHEVIDFTSAPILGEGIKGEAIIEAFKNAKKMTGKKEPFSLKKSFFGAITKAQSTINNMKLNSGRVIYKYDEFGRVYFIANDKRFYINKERTHCISEDGLFASYKLDEDGNVELEYYDSRDATYDPSFINFNYMYISVEAAREGERLIGEQEQRQLQEFIAENPYQQSDLTDMYISEEQSPIEQPRSKVIDLEEYRRRMEEEGRGR